jgi:hypothetical protein
MHNLIVSVISVGVLLVLFVWVGNMGKRKAEIDHKEREQAIISTSQAILDEFEDLLEEHNITIPDEFRTGEESEARLFGDGYVTLECKIVELLKRLDT